MVFSDSVRTHLRTQWGYIAAQHLEEVFSESSLDDNWIAETYGMEVQECGIRNVMFSPRAIVYLQVKIRETWQDFRLRMCGGSTVKISLIVPQPVEATRQYILLFVVSLEPFLRISTPSLVTALVDEVADDDSLSIQPRHAVRVPSPVDKNMLLCHLGLSHFTFPWQFRHVDVWVNETILVPSQPVHIYHGSILTVKFSKRNSNVIKLARGIIGGELFFARAYSFAWQLRGTNELIQVRVHGIDSQNQFLGHRDLFVSFSAIISDAWVDQVRGLWPRCPARAFIALVRKDLDHLHAQNRPHVELIVAFACPVHMAPILIRQQIQVTSSGSVICEEVAFCVHMTCPPSILRILAASLPFRFPIPEYAPLNCDDSTLSDTTRVWEAGDVVTFSISTPTTAEYLMTLTGSKQMQKCHQYAVERGQSLSYSEF